MGWKEKREKMVIDNETFAKMVAEEVKNKLSPSQRNTLLEQHNWDRWQAALVALADNLNNQIMSIDADSDADTQRYSSFGNDGNKLIEESENAYNNRKRKIERFKFHVERRLDDVTKMIETGAIAESNGWEEVSFYRRAIVQHRLMLQEYDLEETSIDRALWAALDKRWEFDKVHLSSI
jgi:hypothetical protein